MTKTTLDQKTSRTLLKKHGAGNLLPLTIALLRYLTNGCYWKLQNGPNSYMERRDFVVSVQSIADNMGCAVHTAQRHIEIAEEKKLITVNRPEGRRISYSLHLDPMKEWPTAATLRRQKEKERKAAKAMYQKSYRDKSSSTLLRISSSPTGADIEIDGKFVGQTPSSVRSASGDHSIAIRQAGYKPWQRKIAMSGGEITIEPELESEAN